MDFAKGRKFKFCSSSDELLQQALKDSFDIGDTPVYIMYIPRADFNEGNRKTRKSALHFVIYSETCNLMCSRVM